MLSNSSEYIYNIKNIPISFSLLHDIEYKNNIAKIRYIKYKERRVQSDKNIHIKSKLDILQY